MAGACFSEILDQNLARPTQKVCRSVRTLALEAIGLGLDSRLLACLALWRTVFGGTSLAGYVAGRRWLTGFVTGSLCLQLGDEAD